MYSKPRIYISSPVTEVLDRRRQHLKKGILKRIINVGFEPQEFAVSGIPERSDWNFSQAHSLMKQCDGALILALARSFVYYDDKEIPVPTEYNHFEGALAIAEHFPTTLVIAEGDMNMRGILLHGGGFLITKIPNNATTQWLRSNQFKGNLEKWVAQVKERRDVFLGYCSKADNTAKAIRDYLEGKGFSVLDWARDFQTGSTILEQIHKAATICRCAIFLFSKDDPIEGKTTSQAIPRDNVLLETGYFIRARDKERVAIIREHGTKMPADLGGVIYLSLKDRSKLSLIQKKLVEFLKQAM